MITKSKRGLVSLYGIDRLTMWVDVPLQINRLPFTLSSEPSVTSRRMRMNPQWKSKIGLSQPTHADLVKIHDALAGYTQLMPNYVEFKIDILASSAAEACSLRNRLISAARFMHVQHRISAFKTTLYVGKRSSRAGSQGTRKGSHVIAAYYDKPSKDLRATKYADQPPCMHFEHRLVGASALAKHGISSLEDLLNFDHEAFHNRMQRMHILPSQTKLGELLASVASPCSLEGPALRKRARTWKAQFMVDGAFCLHNALRDRPELIARLPKQSFTDWLESSLAIH